MSRLAGQKLREKKAFQIYSSFPGHKSLNSWCLTAAPEPAKGIFKVFVFFYTLFLLQIPGWTQSLVTEQTFVHTTEPLTCLSWLLTFNLAVGDLEWKIDYSEDPEPTMHSSHYLPLQRWDTQNCCWQCITYSERLFSKFFRDGHVFVEIWGEKILLLQ